MSATLLSAQQVQGLLGVDASTIYRMASDGRLPAVRIGRQWRFPADAIDALLAPTTSTAATPTVDAPSAIGGDVPILPPVLATAALEAFAPTLGVTMVVTDLSGRPITPVVNPAPAIAQRLDDPAFTAACSAEWRTFADEAHLAPRFQPGRFGFLCAHSLVRHSTALIAMVLAGGIAMDNESTPALFHLDDTQRRAVLDALPRVASLLSLLVEHRSPGS